MTELLRVLFLLFNISGGFHAVPANRPCSNLEFATLSKRGLLGKPMHEPNVRSVGCPGELNVLIRRTSLDKLKADKRRNVSALALIECREAGYTRPKAESYHKGCIEDKRSRSAVVSCEYAGMIRVSLDGPEP